MENQIQFFHQGVEHTTRYELLAKYSYLSWTRLQRLLSHPALVALRVTYKNQFYFGKEATEAFIERMAIEGPGINVGLPKSDMVETEAPLDAASQAAVEAALEAYPFIADDDFFGE